MKIRAITALFFVVAMLASIVVNEYLFALFFIALGTYCLHEFYTVVISETAKPNRRWGLVMGAVGFGLFAAQSVIGFTPVYLLVVVPLLTLTFIIPLYQKGQDKPFSGIAYTLLGFVYVILPFVAFFSLGFVDGKYNYHYPLGFTLILWSHDTGAYLIGKFLGKHRLFERISPKKTWEGLAGGILLALTTALVLAHYFPVLDTWQWLCMSLIISVFGTFGDLVESMLKRSQRVKDSGTFLPGHGGLLDRFDGLLLAAPVVLAFLEIVK